MDIFSYLLGRKYKDSNTGSGSGANITSNIKIVDNKSSVLTSSHNKLCIVNDTGDLSFKVVDKIDGGTEELSTLSEVLPQGLQSSCCATFGNNIYIFGGAGSNGVTNTIYKFNCITKTTETLSVTLPNTLSSACCSAYEDNIYIFGGYSGGYSNTIHKFNCKTETIETLTTTLPYKITSSCCSTYEDNIYIFGGYNYIDGNNFFSNIYKFNCKTNTIFTVSKSLPKALRLACCATCGDNIYIFGGSTINSKLNTIYKFNCPSETIETLSITLPKALAEHSCSLYNDTIYIFGGSYSNTIFKFNCTNETIETLSVILPSYLTNFCCSTYNGNIYIFGGYTSGYLNSILDFSITFNLDLNNVLLYCANSKYNFGLITDQVNIPIKNVYIGDSNNTAQLANAYLYDETKSAWVNVNTGEALN